MIEAAREMALWLSGRSKTQEPASRRKSYWEMTPLEQSMIRLKLTTYVDDNDARLRLSAIYDEVNDHVGEHGSFEGLRISIQGEINDWRAQTGRGLRSPLMNSLVGIPLGEEEEYLRLLQTGHTINTRVAGLGLLREEETQPMTQTVGLRVARYYLVGPTPRPDNAPQAASV
jgi:hypothetical protein